MSQEDLGRKTVRWIGRTFAMAATMVLGFLSVFVLSDLSRSGATIRESIHAVSAAGFRVGGIMILSGLGAWILIRPKPRGLGTLIAVSIAFGSGMVAGGLLFDELAGLPSC